MKKMILDIRGIIIREVAHDVIVSLGSCQAVFTNVSGMKQAAAKIVPKLLNFEQKQQCPYSGYVDDVQRRYRFA